MARPKKPIVQIAKSEDVGKTWEVKSGMHPFIPKTLAEAIAVIEVLFPEKSARDPKALNPVEVLSGGPRVDKDFPALYIAEALAAQAWFPEMVKALGSVRRDDDRLVWVQYPELMKLQITIMDMGDRTHRVGNDRYVVRSRHVVVKAPKKDEAA